MPSPELEVWWDGTPNGFNRGMLNVPSQETRPAPPRTNVVEDWSHLRQPVKMTLLERAADALKGRAMTSAELRAVLGVSQSAASVALDALKQTGKLHEASQTGHPRARGKSYWIVP